MKLNITVDLDDLWCDEEESITESVKCSIIQSTKQAILKLIKDDTEKQIQSQVKGLVAKELTTQIDAQVTYCLENLKVKGRFNDDDLSLHDYIKQQFTDNRGNHNMAKTLADLATKFGKEMKDRYDLMFAAQIVAKMQENALLKDGVEDLLLEKK